MVNILIAFLCGAGCAVYCLRLGMVWSRQAGWQQLPLLPFDLPKKESEREEIQDQTLQHWFEGGGDKP